ncbi:N-acetyl-gamma-glutamyl-phosphate reductase [Gracilibacillus ureilyticus]|uniref:N-acetyl-gamma-glutamyl-phosphate reductase n=1 Tax=Gracilibacillus ureilyticus TaxID=531814 RepID=A0A1H9MXE5_9BACI|nr:N-acetyl-gamma-glutamyl-phosphate reductase [Gracilibacillus ureilyticus]SER28075.1 N-acetyl-gamma-glutamyl-phosphate reductase [Gracilibacillus ureilyticus]
MKVAIVGGTGYGAVELLRFLYNHPHVTVSKIISHSNSGTPFSDVYPHLVNVIDLEMESLDISQLAEEVDLVFFATPSNVSKNYIPGLIDRGVKVIDLSGDFRLRNGKEYEKYYGEEMASSEYIGKAVYGLSEINKNEIANATLVANPGCYPTATTLGLIPVIANNLVNYHSIIIDAKTGTTGAGRSLSQGFHFSEMQENFRAYQLGVHKHIPEIEQVLAGSAKEAVQVSFTPHVVPMTRGIMSTIYVDLKEKQSTKQLLELYKEFYKDKPFVRIREEGIIPQTKEVYGSNFCDIGLYADERTGKLIIISVIDNLVKGASGQAIQNMNIMNGWDETTGINQLPIYP